MEEDNIKQIDLEAEISKLNSKHEIDNLEDQNLFNTEIKKMNWKQSLKKNLIINLLNKSHNLFSIAFHLFLIVIMI